MSYRIALVAGDIRQSQSKNNNTARVYVAVVASGKWLNHSHNSPVLLSPAVYRSAVVLE